MSFFVSFASKDGGEVMLPHGLTVTPIRYTKSIYGGCEQATIEVSGDVTVLWSMLSWLGRRVMIYDRFQNLMWWGLIEEATISRGGLQDGLSIRDMYNRIQIAYTYEEFGDMQSGRTAWGQNDESISKLGFVKELLETHETDATPQVAEAKRQTLLNLLGLPLATSGEGGGKGAAAMTLHCIGDFRTLAWRYYGQPLGIEENDAAQPADQTLGQGMTVVDIGVAANGKISDIGGRFLYFTAGDTVQISGMVNSANNGAKHIDSSDGRPQRTFVSSTVSFDTSDDIHDFAGNGLAFVETDDFISVTGSSGNSRVYRVNSAAADHLTVRPASVGIESAGPAITIVRGNTISIEGATVIEFPDGNARTFTVHGQEIAQSFSVPHSEAWTIAAVELRIRKVNNPDDSVVVRLRQNNSGQPGAIIESAALAGVNISQENGVRRFNFTNTWSLEPNTTYWLTVSRSSVNQPFDYYMVEVDEEESYSRGVMRLWTGSAWVPRNPPASLSFRILGAWETTYQIRRIVEATGQYVDGVDLRANSGVFANQWRDGETLAYDEVLAHLSGGTNLGETLMAEVTPWRTLQISTPPPADPDSAIQQTMDGRYLDQYGRPLPDGVLPVGRWVVRPDIPAAVAAHYKLSPRLVEEAEYDCLASRIRRVRFHGDPDPAKILGF